MLSSFDNSIHQKFQIKPTFAQTVCTVCFAKLIPLGFACFAEKSGNVIYLYSYMYEYVCEIEIVAGVCYFKSFCNVNLNLLRWF